MSKYLVHLKEMAERQCWSNVRPGYDKCTRSLGEAWGLEKFMCKRLNVNLGFTEMPHLLHQLKKYRTWVKASRDSPFNGRSV